VVATTVHLAAEAVIRSIKPFRNLNNQLRKTHLYYNNKQS